LEEETETVLKSVLIAQVNETENLKQRLEATIEASKGCERVISDLQDDLNFSHQTIEILNKSKSDLEEKLSDLESKNTKLKNTVKKQADVICQGREAIARRNKRLGNFKVKTHNQEGSIHRLKKDIKAKEMIILSYQKELNAAKTQACSSEYQKVINYYGGLGRWFKNWHKSRFSRTLKKLNINKSPKDFGIS
jgi:chromosome segregation ATPase